MVYLSCPGNRHEYFINIGFKLQAFGTLVLIISYGVGFVTLILAGTCEPGSVLALAHLRWNGSRAGKGTHGFLTNCLHARSAWGPSPFPSEGINGGFKGMKYFMSPQIPLLFPAYGKNPARLLYYPLLTRALIKDRKEGKNVSFDKNRMEKAAAPRYGGNPAADCHSLHSDRHALS